MYGSFWEYGGRKIWGSYLCFAGHLSLSQKLYKTNLFPIVMTGARALHKLYQQNLQNVKQIFCIKSYKKRGYYKNIFLLSLSFDGNFCCFAPPHYMLHMAITHSLSWENRKKKVWKTYPDQIQFLQKGGRGGGMSWGADFFLSSVKNQTCTCIPVFMYTGGKGRGGEGLFSENVCSFFLIQRLAVHIHVAIFLLVMQKRRKKLELWSWLRVGFLW